MSSYNGLNSKIDAIFVREATEAERHTLKGKIKAILQAEDKKQSLLLEFSAIKQSLSKEGLFALFVIFVFIFALTYIVM